MPTKFEAIKVNVEIAEVTLEELISRGMELREKKDNISWEMGDLASEVTKSFGARFLKEFAKGTGIEAGTIRRYRDVARAYPFAVREEFAERPWSLFRLLAAHPDRLQILRRASDEGWSVEKTAMMIKPDQTDVIDDGKVVPPKPEMTFCVTCRKWFVTYENELCKTRGEFH